MRAAGAARVQNTGTGRPAHPTRAGDCRGLQRMRPAGWLCGGQGACRLSGPSRNARPCLSGRRGQGSQHRDARGGASLGHATGWVAMWWPRSLQTLGTEQCQALPVRPTRTRVAASRRAGRCESGPDRRAGRGRILPMRGAGRVRPTVPGRIRRMRKQVRASPNAQMKRANSVAQIRTQPRAPGPRSTPNPAAPPPHFPVTSLAPHWFLARPRPPSGPAVPRQPASLWRGPRRPRCCSADPAAACGDSDPHTRPRFWPGDGLRPKHRRPDANSGYVVTKELADSPGRAGMPGQPGPAYPADADKGRSIATRGAVRA